MNFTEHSKIRPSIGVKVLTEYLLKPFISGCGGFLIYFVTINIAQFLGDLFYKGTSLLIGINDAVIISLIGFISFFSICLLNNKSLQNKIDKKSN